MTRVDGATAEWRRIARNDDVLYSITSWPDKRGRWTNEDFYDSGRSDWEDFRSHWLHFAPDLGGTCVEIGCGAGRLTLQLAEHFDRVIGLDVSDDMITMTRGVVPENVELVRVDGPTVPLADGEADAVFSVHVLQHLETHQNLYDYMADARRALRDGGTMMIHLTISSRLRSRLWRAKEEARLRWSRRRLRHGKGHTAVRMRVYRPEQILHMLGEELGFSDVELRAFAARSNGYVHHFFLARR